MNFQELKQDAYEIAFAAIDAVKPDEAVSRALINFHPEGRLFLVAVGKAGWQMAFAAVKVLNRQLTDGIVLTKYDHVKGEIPGVRCFEAGHPVPDENSYRGTKEVLKMTADLTAKDTVLFLLSGGGSALFEKPLVSSESLQKLTGDLLACGADITEINTIRKRLSGVKGGRFGLHCAPAKVYSIILSDVLGDPLDMIASGPSAIDRSTCTEAWTIIERYHLEVSEEIRQCLMMETPKELANVENHIIGSVRQLCQAASVICREKGYEPVFLTDSLACEAKEAGSFLASIARSSMGSGKKAYLAGGETIVHLTGKGKGGRNQELALGGAKGIEGLCACIFSVGSDGTDGPTDAAGGYVDGSTMRRLREKGISLSEVLGNNDAYPALKALDDLIVTGPTGTNVNDLSVCLVAE